MRQVLAEFLRAIPQSNQEAASIATLVQGDTTEATPFVTGVAYFLKMWGIVWFDEDHKRIQATSQAAKYTLNSLAEFIANDLTLISDWKTRGVNRDEAAGPFQNGATFLALLDAYRVAHEDNPQPSRQEKVAQVLIKRTDPQTGQAELLLQFDRNANQYQFIGGRWRESDGPVINTMVREIEEELEGNDLIFEKAYNLALVADDLVPNLILSPTFGALTEYHFWIYHMLDLAEPLTLQADDRWVPVEQILSGAVITEDDQTYPFQNNDIFQRIHEAIPGGLAALVDSQSDNES